MADHYIRTGLEGVRYASMVPIALDPKTVAKYEALRGEETDEWVEERLAALRARVVEGEPIETTLQQAAWAYAHGARIRAYGRESQASGVAQFVALLNEEPEPLTEAERTDTSKRAYKNAMDKHVRRVREAAKNERNELVSWQDMYHWTHDGTREKEGSPLVPANVIRAIDNKIEEGKAAAARRVAAAKAKKAAKETAA